MRHACFWVCAVLFAEIAAFAQSLNGTYTMQTSNGTFTLVLQENGSQLSGRLTGATGHTMELQGEIDAGVGMGVIRDNQGGVFFETFFEGHDLVLMLIEPDANNMPDYNKMRELVFQRRSGAAPAPSSTTSPAPGPAAPPPVAGGLSGGTSGSTADPHQKRGNTATAPGRTPKGYSGGGTTISDEQAGVSLTVPSGWKAQKQQAGGYVLASDTHPGLILITGHSYNSVQQMEQDSGEGIQDPKNNTSLMFTGQSAPVGNNGLGCEMSGSVQGTPARAYTVGLVSPYGGGITIIALTSSEAYTGQYRQWAEQMAASTRFTEPKLDTALMQWFAGKYWRYTSSSSYTSVYATESSMTFCANGLYEDSYESGGSGTGSDQYGNQNMSYGAVGTQQGRARWTIRGNKRQGVITIFKPDGSSYDVEYRAVGEGQDMYFDGTRYNWVNRGDCN